MEINVVDKDAYTLVSFDRKRLDAAFAPQFRERMHELVLQGRQTIILDLSAIDFIDSSGLGAIVAAFKLLQAEGELLLCGASSNVQQLFKLTRMDRVFVLYPNVDDAIKALRG